MNAKHTQWATSKDAVPEGITQVTIYNETTGKRVATVFESDAVGPIAAAPELLECLRAVEDRISGNVDVYNRFVPTSERIADSLRLIRAALAKARGE